jgi:DNA invertase Pin-like site-specific DNA recombinase
MISKRTKDALAATKARGKKLGGVRFRQDESRVVITKRFRLQERAAARAADIAPAIRELQAAGAESLRAVAKGLNDAGIPTPRGQGSWSATQVQRVLDGI